MKEGWKTCECRGSQSDGVKCNHGSRRCRNHAKVELKVRHSEGGWWGYCEGCADAIMASGVTRALDRRPMADGREWIS